MARLVGLLLACLFSVAPSADALCKAACAPVPHADSACHESAPAVSPHGQITASSTCSYLPLLVGPPADARRLTLLPAQVTGAAASSTDDVSGSARASRSWPLRHGAAQTWPRCIVLRI